MSDSWRLIDSGPCDAAYNMALDEAVAVAVRKGSALPTLRFYGWSCPSVSLGAFQRIGDVDLQHCASAGIPVVRRPTGGRGILHGRELTYSISAPNERFPGRGLMETYGLISAAILDAVTAMGVPAVIKSVREKGRVLAGNPLCFQSVSYGELTCNGKKLVGSAQKRWPDGFLQQGSIPYVIDRSGIVAVFRRTDGTDMAGLADFCAEFDQDLFKHKLRKAFEKVFRLLLMEAAPSPAELGAADLLIRQKYGNAAWNLTRTLERTAVNGRP